MTNKTIAVFADTVEAYEELCSGARALGCEPVALFAGRETDAERVAAWGAYVRYVGEIPEGALFEDCVDAFEQALRDDIPALVLARMTKGTQCVAGRLAVRLDAPVVTDVSRVALSDEGATFARLVYGGAAERVELVRGLAIALVGAGVFEMSAAQSAGVVERQERSVEPGPLKLISMQKRQEEVVDLSAAKVVVCVGRGIGTKENVAAAQGFAAGIGAEMACTRPIAEGEGWMARSRYLGVSGSTIKPDVYVGLGLSGQVQHTVGMSESRFVAVVNRDKNAPIMKRCDVGLVADVEKVLPLLAVL